MLGTTFEAAALWIKLEQPMNGLRFEPGLLGHPLRHTVGAEQELHSLGGQYAENRVDDGGLADPRSSGEDQAFDSRASRIAAIWLTAIVDPITRGRDPFSGGDRGGVADNGGEIAVPSRLHTQNAETGLGAVECHPLDDAGEHLAVGLRGGRWHGHGQDYSPSLEEWRAASQMAMARLLPARGLCARKSVSV